MYILKFSNMHTMYFDPTPPSKSSQKRPPHTCAFHLHDLKNLFLKISLIFDLICSLYTRGCGSYAGEWAT